MGALEEARRHLAKAQEFILAAERGVKDTFYNAATSNAVLAGISAKDAICLRLTGRTGKSEDHRQAVPELAAAGPAGKELETTFGRLLRLKSTSQYESTSIARDTAIKAVEWATRMVDKAEEVVGS